MVFELYLNAILFVRVTTDASTHYRYYGELHIAATDDELHDVYPF